MAACQSAFAADAGRTLLVIGDSLSAGFGLEPGQGWVALLQDRLEAEGYGYRVVNASITGDTTTGGVGRLPRALQLHRPAVVVIELGGNDGLRGTPIPVIRDNMAEMIRLAQQAQARVVLAGLKMPPNYGERYTSAFEAMYAELAARHGVALIDFFMDGVALNPRFMQPDGIHPNAAGQARLLENAWPVIEKQLRATSGRH
ncbi:MAG: arylesterase [Gammaproteobacteria bacterium]|nr:MAG: arylesterase [Gammaproteobacteria bacterium]